MPTTSDLPTRNTGFRQRSAKAKVFTNQNPRTAPRVCYCYLPSYRRGEDGGGGGGGLIRGAGGGELILGGGELILSDDRVVPPREAPGPIPGCIMERGGAMEGCDGIRCVTIPFVCTWCETLAMFESPRGTPSPAELFWITILLPDRFAKVVTGPRFTVRMVVPLTGAAAGGWGRLNPFGVFKSIGWE